jgi:hypothetical protein
MESNCSPVLINLDVMAVNKEWLRSYLAGRRSVLVCCEGTGTIDAVEELQGARNTRVWTDDARDTRTD